MLYRIFLTFIFLTILTKPTIGQIICSIPVNRENLRPDTITVFSFLEKNVEVKNVPKAKPISNHSFQTNKFTLIWVYVHTEDMDAFAKNSLSHWKNIEIIDTLQCFFQEKNHTAVLKKIEDNFRLFIYPKQSGAQYIFSATFKKQIQANKILKYLNKHL